MDDLDQFVAEERAKEHRSEVREWFALHPDVGNRAACGFHEQGYPATKIHRWLKKTHGYTFSLSPTESWLKAHKPDGH